MNNEIVQHADGFDLPNGFIGYILHHPGAAEFVSTGDEAGQGFWRFNREGVISERYEKNLIVTNASKFMAKRMRPNVAGATWGTGLSHLEIGTGFGTGTAQNPQAENSAQVALRTPASRKAITSWTCLDNVGTPTGTDTNIIQLTTTFLENDVSGAIVEMGMFGGDASATLGSGQMFNYKVFPAINKDNTMQLTFIWKLTF